MNEQGNALRRPALDGKFFRAGADKLCLKGLTYGPFGPISEEGGFHGPARTRQDFAMMREMGVNAARVYALPPVWVLDAAAEHGLRLLVDLPWNKHVCFLEDADARKEARVAVRKGAQRCQGHPGVLAVSIANEIPSDIVRWSGPSAVEAFLDELVDISKSVDPDLLCTFGSYPPTEFLNPGGVDFLCFNVYLHKPAAFRNYLARLQMLADTRPLILGEVGMDSLREGEENQSQFCQSQIETAFRAGVAGMFVYSFTDEWFKDGRQIEDWRFGLTRRDRSPKPAFHAVRDQFARAPYFAPARQPRTSVVVACYNGSRTLRTCLNSLQHLNYPDYEVIVVDDGSTDETPEICREFPFIRYLRQDNRGLSDARNAGIEASSGEIVAFTDADCRPDPDWLYHTVSELVADDFAGVGGHNFLPPDDSRVATAVMASPGGPAHVMLTDKIAEHIPGCNMVFWKWALHEIGGFDVTFRKAGDDVDVCWRLQQRGFQLGFSSGGFVWHYRRSTVREYLRQQQGYGEAEAMLERKHPEYINPMGASMWRGRIYSSAYSGLITRRPIVYHGPFGTGLFQSLYSAPASLGLLIITSLEYHVVVTCSLVVLSTVSTWFLPLAVASLGSSVAVTLAAAMQARIPRRKLRWWSRPLVALLFLLQPVVRGWARYRGRLVFRYPRLVNRETVESYRRKQIGYAPDRRHYWSEQPGYDRQRFLAATLAELETKQWAFRTDSGWNDFDIEISGSPWTRLQLATASEFDATGRQRLRCRLTTSWSFQARVVFWAILASLVVASGLLDPWRRWMWLGLLLWPAFAIWLSAQKRTLRRIVGVLLDEVALSHGLMKLEPIPGSAEDVSKARKAPEEADPGLSA